MTVPADNPIRGRNEDRLGRARMAEVIAHEIRALDASEGVVLGILGPWGSGKTSLLNMVRNELTEPPGLVVLDFNPWLFSGADELLESFFLELGAQLRGREDRLRELADDLEHYGEVIAPLRHLPVIGVWVERARTATSAIKKARERRKGGVQVQRSRLAKKLLDLQAPLIIIVDDIDRLRTSEIRDIFKLVRLTANFPNIIYVLAFDRQRVENALSEEGLNGRDYLEKILQVAYDVPVVPQHVLTRLLTEEIDASLQDVANPGPFDAQRWPDVLMEVVRPPIRNMRDVRRYVASLHGTLEGLDGQVSLVDVLALEVLRVFLPDVFAALTRAQEGLTTHSPASFGGYGQEPPRLKQQIDDLVAAAGDNKELVHDLIGRLFPAAGRHVGGSNYGPDWASGWLRDRRVAHAEVLRFYLERLAGDELAAFGLAERVFPLLGAEEALNDFLNALEGTRLADTITALEVYQEEYDPASVEVASTALMNQIVRVPERPGAFLSTRPDMIVGRVVLRMLRRLDGPDEVEAVVRRILPKLNHLSSRLDLLLLVGHKEDAGHKLITEEAWVALEAELRAQVRATATQELASEWDLLRLLWWTRSTGSNEEPILELADNVPEFDIALLESAVTTLTSRQMDSRAVTSRKRLHWDTLVEAAGGEAALRALVQRLGDVADPDDELADALDLAEQYLGGWRPPEFGDV